MDKVIDLLNEEFSQIPFFDIKQGNPEQSLALLNATEQRLDSYYLREVCGLTSRKSLLEIYRSTKPCWQLLKANLNAKCPTGKVEDVINNKVKLKGKGASISSEVKSVTERYNECKKLIKHCLNDNFPSHS